MSGSTVAKGNNSRKTKAQLIDELGRLQRRVDELALVADRG